MSVREVRLSALSATMESATLLQWTVQPGDTVSEGQPIAEVSTDKVDMDLEAPFAGTIVELSVEPGSEIPLGGLLATIETEAEDLLGGLDLGGGSAEGASEPEPKTVKTPAANEAPEGAAPGAIVPASPPARKMARRHGIDLSQIDPTGRRGQITPSDVAKAIDRLAGGSLPRPAPRVAEPKPAAATSKAAPSTAAPAPPVDDARRLAIKRATVEAMNRSAVVPQFTLYRTVDLEPAANRRAGASWTTVLVRALAVATREHPELNASWNADDGVAVGNDGVKVGLAVDRPGVGLVVSSIADPDLADLDDADAAVRALVDRTRTGKLRPEDMGAGSVTLSNLGGIGVDRFEALLFPPQAIIMSVGTIRHRPVAKADGSLRATLTAEVGLTVDHRVADGADGARFLQTFVDALS
jgi:pyruvate dehydrogenase E2 component (dihydrolipoamide acetyltransferase)